MNCLNKDRGCKAVLKADDFQQHQDECQFMDVNCKYCGRVYLKINEQVHKNICSEYEVECNQCHEKIKQINLNHHKENECPYNLEVVCDGCKKKIILAYFQEHQSNCKESLMECACGQILKADEKEAHKIEYCIGKKFKSLRKKYVEEFEQLEKHTEILSRRYKNLDTYLEEKCDLCEEIVCDVYKKECYGCKCFFCKSCQKKIFRSCKYCQTKYCEACSSNFTDNDHCLKCKPKDFQNQMQRLIELNKYNQIILQSNNNYKNQLISK